MPGRMMCGARSVLALVLALLAVPAVNLGGAWLSDRVFALPPGGTLRLAVDLWWVFLSGIAGTALAVKTAAVGKTAHAWLVFAIYAAAVVHGAVTMGDDFPRWFVIGLAGLLPLQAWLGWWLAWGRRRRA